MNEKTVVKGKSSLSPKLQCYSWHLPSLFGGNKLNSYAGRISFALKNNPGIRAGEVSRVIIINILVGVGEGSAMYFPLLYTVFRDNNGHRQRLS